MSVLAHKRSTSKLEFFHNAYVLRKEISFALFNDFGINKRAEKIRERLKEGMDITEARSSLNEEEFYPKGIYEYIKDHDYPEWMFSFMRNNMSCLLSDLVKNIIKANSIYPINKWECIKKRRYQTEAIGICNCIIQELEYYIDIFPIKRKTVLYFVDKITKEIRLLKGWRKSNNIIQEKIENNQTNCDNKQNI